MGDFVKQGSTWTAILPETINVAAVVDAHDTELSMSSSTVVSVSESTAHTASIYSQPEPDLKSHSVIPSIRLGEIPPAWSRVVVPLDFVLLHGVNIY